MKAKKILIFIAVIAVIAVGSFFYQNNKQDKELATHNVEKFEQIKEAAKSSSVAGLVDMATAINKYRETHDHYPDRLMMLYPDFIPDKEFIQTLNWQYAKADGTYKISRSLEGKARIASIGPDLKPSMSSSQTPAQPVQTEKIASVKERKIKVKKTSSTLLAAAKKTKPEIIPGSAQALAAFARSNTNISSTVPKIAALPNANAKKEDDTFAPAVIPKKLNLKEQYLTVFTGKEFYIWKTDDGVVGFSNVKYPDTKQLIIYRDRTWIEYNFDNLQ